ncbi:hypothetical protein [Bifidobacterium castoris]|uniref:Uncharacterized protein n=1 Tax=Bifidobacterium castoris TaxID=2306972 RepID=A0A430FAJ2_9BIFI|nr:hypothetical protein [Bifidobacterium castoris]RSX49812.1 hypothetical protein D2E22_0273 [Bifidobacterium castoris]
MRIVQETLAVSTWVVCMIVVWKVMQGTAPTWWLLTFAIASTLFVFFYRTADLLPLPYELVEIIMGVLAVVFWALLMVLMLSVAGILPAMFAFQ